jgi:60 kDa SS-A/Ro ribonucleoprotein
MSYRLAFTDTEVGMAGELSRLGGARITSQMEQADPAQVRNDEGAYVFEASPEQRLMRFLLIGVDEPTYYATAKNIAVENATVVTQMMQDENTGLAAVATAQGVSLAGRAKNNDPALWVLACAAASPHMKVRQAAAAVLPQVARTGTHLFTFAEYVKKQRGWGRTLRRAVGNWYSEKPVKSLALQAVKYRQRGGWTHRDMLRLSHGYVHARAAAPAQKLGSHEAVLDFMCGRPNLEMIHSDSELDVLTGYLEAQARGENLTSREAVELIRNYSLPREALPTHVLTSPEVWEALLPHMGATALIRNLPTMTRVGYVTDYGAGLDAVTDKLGSTEWLRRSRVHPLQVLIALMTYGSGRSVRGSHTWTPVAKVVDALDAAFYGTYGNVQPTGKRIYLALDISGSMTWAQAYGPGDSVFHIANISPMLMSAAVALVTANVEPRYVIRGFNHFMVDLDISPRMRLDQAVNHMLNKWDSGGRTDCAQPYLDAKRRKQEFDAFITYTDSESWAGKIHPHQAIRQYRASSGIHSKGIVVAMTANRFSVADPKDPNQLDVVGFDASVPELIAEFIR